MKLWSFKHFIISLIMSNGKEDEVNKVAYNPIKQPH